MTITREGKTRLTLPMCEPDQPLNDTQLVKYLRTHYKCRADIAKLSYLDILDGYLALSGYKQDKHYLSSTYLEWARNTIEIYQNSLCVRNETHSLQTISKPKGLYSHAIYYWPAKGEGRYVYANDTLIAMIKDSGAIYGTGDRLHSYYYLKEINGYLFLKYQQIIGSSRLCRWNPSEAGIPEGQAIAYLKD